MKTEQTFNGQKYIYTTAAFLKNARKAAKVTQSEIAAHLGLENPQFVSLMENGHSKMPIKLINKYCEVLRIDSAQLKKVLISDYERGLDAIIRSKGTESVRSNKTVTGPTKGKSAVIRRPHKPRF
jgi:transcriptional regulator with XRE-family HTH domain